MTLLEGEQSHPTLVRLNSLRSYYSSRGGQNRAWHYVLKGVEIVLAASIPAGALLGAQPPLLGVLGAFVAVVATLQQVYQPHFKWIRYRSANERLKREKHLYEVQAGPYERSEDPLKLLAVRLEDAVAEEHSEWSSRMLSASATPGRNA